MTMRVAIAVAGLFLMSLGAAQAAQEVGEGDDLFFSPTLVEWQWIPVGGNQDADMGSVWKVQDKLLTVVDRKQHGYLQTKRSFKDFKLVVEWRWQPGTKPGNSGVLMRTAPWDPGKGW